MRNNLTYQYKTANILVKLIVINIAAFLVVRLGAFFLSISPYHFSRWFVLSDDLDTLLIRPWTLISYGFLHFDFFHILFNMVWLYWFGKFALTLFTGKRVLTVYMLGALFGGLLFVFSYNLFPVFEENRGLLIGASGAVTAIMVFIATYSPNTQVRIFSFTIKPSAKKPLKTVHRTKQATTKRAPATDSKTDHQKKIDLILDKIGKSGYESLTKAEKDFLFKAGKED